MSCVCDVGLEEIFTERFARHDAAQYRKHGPPRRAQHLLKLIAIFMDLRNRRSLEGGAGAGALTVELARRGVAFAETVDAVPVAVDYSRRLAAEFGVADRTHFRIGDFADPALSGESADLVILDRVLCCYPDWRGLLSNAVRLASRVIALSYPTGNSLSRFMVFALNGGQALLRRRFRMYVHPPDVMLAVLEQHGFNRVVRKRYWMWEITVAARS